MTLTNLQRYWVYQFMVINSRGKVRWLNKRELRELGLTLEDQKKAREVYSEILCRLDH